MTFDTSDPMSLAKYIDHTILKPEATLAQVGALCEEAKQYGFASVCVNPSFIKYVSDSLAGSGVAACAVIGFPLGATPAVVKAFETETVIDQGAAEVDMVMNIGAAKSGDWVLVQNDISAVVAAARGRAHIKVIIETCLLTDEEKVKACKAAKAAGADFVKTSTGFSTGGATTGDVKLMREAVGPVMGVKASGGIRDIESAVAMLNAGATRLGTSAGVKIVTNF